jgi:hypothetical protein
VHGPCRARGTDRGSRSAHLAHRRPSEIDRRRCRRAGARAGTSAAEPVTGWSRQLRCRRATSPQRAMSHCDRAPSAGVCRPAAGGPGPRFSAGEAGFDGAGQRRARRLEWVGTAWVRPAHLGLGPP